MTYRIGGIEMKLPILIGAGACKSPQSLVQYMRRDVSVGAVCTGSYTPKHRDPNQGVPLFWPDHYGEFTGRGFGLNSFGMPNVGFADAAKALLALYLHPVVVSVAGFSVADFVKGVQIFDRHPGIAAVKLNVGCPNTENIPFAYDLASLRGILLEVSWLRIKKPLWLKLSPYITAAERDALQVMYPEIDFSQVPVTESGFLGQVLDLVREYRFVRAVVFSNTLGNVVVRDAAGKPVTSPNQGRAGLSGRILKDISIGLVRQAVTMLPEEIDVIGSGGVLQGDDVVDYLGSGAKGVCCTSGPFWSGQGPRFPSELLAGSEKLQNYLTQNQPN